ncbi:MAG: hypothetical protein D6734_13050 [Candidatus Schekmanbacteria bacterium]|nr:MAG: hypothetical protein D6734_13050 [Candidatus Schekmanbacteria bacterium]
MGFSFGIKTLSSTLICGESLDFVHGKYVGYFDIHYCVYADWNDKFLSNSKDKDRPTEKFINNTAKKSLF